MSVSLSMNTSLMNTSGPFRISLGRVDEVALHVEDELALRRPDLRARELLVERRFARQVEEAAGRCRRRWRR
jgi:hypothetical protein